MKVRGNGPVLSRSHLKVARKYISFHPCHNNTAWQSIVGCWALAPQTCLEHLKGPLPASWHRHRTVSAQARSCEMPHTQGLLACGLGFSAEDVHSWAGGDLSEKGSRLPLEPVVQVAEASCLASDARSQGPRLTEQAQGRLPRGKTNCLRTSQSFMITTLYNSINLILHLLYIICRSCLIIR